MKTFKLTSAAAVFVVATLASGASHADSLSAAVTHKVVSDHEQSVRSGEFEGAHNRRATATLDAKRQDAPATAMLANMRAHPSVNINNLPEAGANEKEKRSSKLKKKR